MKKIEFHILDKIVDREFFKDKDKMKVVVVHKSKNRYENDLVVMRYKDFMEITGGLLQKAEIISD